MIESAIEELLAIVFGDAKLTISADGQVQVPSVESLSGEEVQYFLTQLLSDLSVRGSVDDRAFPAVMRQFVRRSAVQEDADLSEVDITLIEEIYDRLDGHTKGRSILLQWLASSPDERASYVLTERLVTDPPATSIEATLVISEWVRRRTLVPDVVFPRIFDALSTPALAPAILDLSNFVTREKIVGQHPAADRHESLANLLSALVQRLGRIEENGANFSGDAKQLSAVVSDSISMAVSLCDALALIGQVAHVGKLNQAMQLRHRRLRTEAAAGLTRLGDENGRQVLISLAAEPVMRLRVLTYAEEMGLMDQVDEKFTTASARAESELALWLAQPQQFGFPPSDMELVDSQVMHWPGFEETIQVFLFRFSYEVGEGIYSNIGIAGPLCHAFAADLGNLPPADIYATFAGWHAQHEEIFEWDVTQMSEGLRVDVARFERRIRDFGYDAVQPLTMGVFFGDKALIARATKQGQTGIVIADHEDVTWLPPLSANRPFGPVEAYALFKGRRLLRSFNA